MQLTQGMTALVTGGVSGLGEASAVALLERGLNVVAVDLNEERGAAMEKQYAGQLQFIKADVADAEQMQRRCLPPRPGDSSAHWCIAPASAARCV